MNNGCYLHEAFAVGSWDGVRRRCIAMCRCRVDSEDRLLLLCGVDTAAENPELGAVRVP